MALQLEQKERIVGEVRDAAATALSAVLADYRGLTVADLTELRRRARDTGVYLRVVRNTLFVRAVAGTELECLVPAASGPTMLALAHDDPGSAARLLRDAADEYGDLDVKAVSIGGRMYPGEDIDRVASLPTRDEAIATLMALMLAPVAKLTRTLNEVPAKLTRTLAAISENKEQQPGQA